MDLYVIRHAAAGERDPSRWSDDSKRPLTDDGRKKFRRVARLLGEIVDDKPLVLASRWLRAWDTAMILTKETGWPAPQPCAALEVHPNEEVLDALRAHSDEKAIALVGHEPQLSELISLLLTGDEDAVQIDFKKGAAVSLTLPSTLAPGDAALNWIVTPGLVKA